MDPNDREQTELLRSIWNEMKALGENLGGRIDKTNERLDKTNERLESLETRVDTRLAGIDGRLAVLEAHAAGTNERLDRVEGALHELATQQLMLGRYVKNAADRHDGAIEDLRERVSRLESERKG